MANQSQSVKDAPLVCPGRGPHGPHQLRVECYFMCGCDAGYCNRHTANPTLLYKPGKPRKCRKHAVPAMPNTKPKRKKKKLPKVLSDYMAEIGAKGGAAGTGAAKARKVTSEQARAAVMARWAKRKKGVE